MKIFKYYKKIWIGIVVLGIGFALFGIQTSLGIEVLATSQSDYGESYRNHLSYSAKEGWNNDPNGLLYVPNADGNGGTYHLYYQYNWNQHSQTTENVWGNMSWGHATSEDLVSWEEQPVALPAYQEVDGKQYNMMFSGSAVYDQNNTSGLFETDDNGIIKNGQGIVAVLTQPTEVQRQILAYSMDNGHSFQIYGEILSGTAEGSLGDNEFRDPKVFWSDAHQKWLMVVGGGAVRMYASDNLINWTYLGQTGLWGECPDLSCYTISGQKKYALIISPEDKPNSHKFNGTTREDTFYPAEYYSIGELDESGLFIPQQPLRRLSEGVDSYAFQSFNNCPENKVYGISWSACWKNVDSYKDFRKTHNGGLTIACELNLIQDELGYALTRKPVEQFKTLRDKQIANFNEKLLKGINGLSGVHSDIADIELEFDFNESKANKVEIELRKSIAEKVSIFYDREKQEFTFDRSESSLLAEHTPYYNWKQVLKNIQLKEGILSLRIILDRAFISIFINNGEQSIFSAIFPSSISNGMSIKADSNLNVNAQVWEMKSIYGEIIPHEETIYTTDKLDLIVDETKAVITSSFKSSLEVIYLITEGKDCIELMQDGNVAFIKGKKSGSAKILVNNKEISVYVYNAGFESDVKYSSSLFGHSYETNQGLVLEHSSDAFLFSNEMVNDFTYSASIEVLGEGQASGLLFGLSDNYFDYLVATVDFKDNVIKLWRAGVGDLKVAHYDFGGRKSCTLSVEVKNQTIKVYVNEENNPSLLYLHEEYRGGKLGLNVYNSSTIFNHITLFKDTPIHFDGEEQVNIVINQPIVKIVNITDDSYRLLDNEYIYENKVLYITKEYLTTLASNKDYVFRIITDDGYQDLVIHTSFAEANIESLNQEYMNTDQVIFKVEDLNEIRDVFMDGKRIEEYQFKNNQITLSEELVLSLVSGTHTIQIYTDNGRPSSTFTIVEQPIIVPEQGPSANHIFFYVDISIFIFFILGYISFTVYKKRRGKKGGNKHE